MQEVLSKAKTILGTSDKELEAISAAKVLGALDNIVTKVSKQIDFN